MLTQKNGLTPVIVGVGPLVVLAWGCRVFDLIVYLVRRLRIPLARGSRR